MFVVVVVQLISNIDEHYLFYSWLLLSSQIQLYNFFNSDSNLWLLPSPSFIRAFLFFFFSVFYFSLFSSCRILYSCSFESSCACWCLLCCPSAKHNCVLCVCRVCCNHAPWIRSSVLRRSKRGKRPAWRSWHSYVTHLLKIELHRERKVFVVDCLCVHWCILWQSTASFMLLLVELVAKLLEKFLLMLFAATTLTYCSYCCCCCHSCC